MPQMDIRAGKCQRNKVSQHFCSRKWVVRRETSAGKTVDLCLHCDQAFGKVIGPAIAHVTDSQFADKI